jgi:predicted Ser/Thr protein kinase
MGQPMTEAAEELLPREAAVRLAQEFHDAAVAAMVKRGFTSDEARRLVRLAWR